MTYEVTATRRRPQFFDQLIGQEFVVATLKNAITSGQIAHAYLFSGPRGCGKTTSARLLARALNCEKGPTATPCGQCSACKEIARGSSLDVIEIDGASNTSVEGVRQIKDEVLFPPNSCRYKVYIIDEVHMLSNSAFNALLKTIEEPPPYVIFIFATTELHKVPATIKSRCQQFMFRLGSVDQIKNMLAAAASETGLKADDEALFWIAREATGSFRDAYTLFDQVAAFSEGHITYEKIRDKLGLVGLERLNELCEDCVDGNIGPALEKIDVILQGGISIEQFISNFADYIRSLLLIRCGITREALIGQNVNRFSKKVLNAWNNVQLERALSMFLNLFRDVRYSLSPRFELELAVSRLCWLSDYVSATEVKKVIAETKQLLLNGTQKEMQNFEQQQVRMNSQQSQSPDVNQMTSVQQSVPPMKKFSILEEQENNVGGNTFGAPNNFADNLGGSHPFHDSDCWQEKEDFSKNASSAVAFKNSIYGENSVTNFSESNERGFNDVHGYSSFESFDIDNLRDAVIQKFQNENNQVIATSIMQTTAWNFENNSIVMIVENEFHRQQIKREINTILQAIVALTKRQLSLEVRLEKPLIQKEEKQNLPETITLLCETFDGNVAEMRDLVVTQNNIKQEDERTDENQNEYMTTEENEDEF